MTCPMSSLLMPAPSPTAPLTSGVRPASHVRGQPLPALYRGPMPLPNPRSRHAEESLLFSVLMFRPRPRWSRARSSTLTPVGGALPPHEVPSVFHPPLPFPTRGPRPIRRKTFPVVFLGHTNDAVLPTSLPCPRSAVAHLHLLSGKHRITCVYLALLTISPLLLSELAHLCFVSLSLAMSCLLMPLQPVKHSSAQGDSGSTFRPETSFVILVMSPQHQTAHNLC